MKKNKEKLQNFLATRSRRFYVISFIISSILVFGSLFVSYKFQAFQQLGLIGIFLGNFIGSAAMFFPAPSAISVFIGGEMYPPLLVALVGTIGSTLGEAVGFLLGLSTQKMTNFKKHKILYNLLDFTFQKYGFWIVVVFSAIPNPVFDCVGILAGLTSFSIKRFLVAVFIGRLIRNIALAYLGNVWPSMLQ